MLVLTIPPHMSNSNLTFFLPHRYPLVMLCKLKTQSTSQEIKQCTTPITNHKCRHLRLSFLKKKFLYLEQT